MSKIQKDLEELKALLTKHLEPSLQALEDHGIELVIVGGKGPLLTGAGNTVAIVGTVKSEQHVFLLLVQALREMRPDVEIRLPSLALPAQA